MMRRRSRGKTLRINSKGPRITGVSGGMKGFRVSAGSRGVRLNTTNPVTGSRKSTGCFGCGPTATMLLFDTVAVVALRFIRR